MLTSSSSKSVDVIVVGCISIQPSLLKVQQLPRLHEVEDLSRSMTYVLDAEIELMNMVLSFYSNEIYLLWITSKDNQELGARVERLMRGTIQNQVDREAWFTNEFDQFVAEPGESLVSVCNLRLAKQLTVDSFDDLFDYLSQFEKLVNASRAKKLEKSHDPLALVAHTGSSSRNTSFIIVHPSFVVDYDEVTILHGQCYKCGGKGHYARNYPKPRVRDSKMEEIKELSANILLVARNFTPADQNSNDEQRYEFCIYSEFYFEFFKTLFQRDIKEMKDVFESTESELCELEKQNDFLKDQLLEVSLKHEVELSVLLNHECVDNSLHAEIEQLKKKSIEIQEGLQARIKILEKDNKNTNPLDYSWISKMEKLEDENVSLDFTVQSLIKERDNVKLEYQKLFNSIKKTRSQTQTEMDELIAHVSEKTYAYGAIRAENQNLLFTISELKTRLANVEKGIYAASSVRRPMNRDSHVKNSVLANSKKPAKKVAVYVRKNKQTDNTSENVISNKENVIDVDVSNASKAKTLLCVSCMQNVVQIVLWIVDSGCSKHMTGDQSLLNNFIEKFMCTVRFGNDNFAAITGYGDYIQVPKLQPAEDLQGDALLHYDAEMELMNLILLSIPNDIYNSVDACTLAKDMWKRVEREALVSVYNRFAQLMNNLERNDMHFLIVTINTKFLNRLQLEWLKYVTQVRLAKRLTVDMFDDLFDYLQQFEKLVNVSRAKKLEKSHDPLALVAHMDEYQQDDVHTNSEDPLTSAMLLLARAITQKFSTPTNNRLRTSSNTRNQTIIQGDRVNIQTRNSGNAGRNNRRAYVQEEIIKGSNAPNETGNVQRTLRTSSSGNTSTVQCYNCSGKVHYVRNCPKPRVRDSKYFMEQMLLAKQDEAGVILTDEQNNFIFADASRMEDLKNSVQSSSNTENEEQMYPTHTKIINSTISDDQIDSDIIFDSSNGNVNSGSIEKDTHVPDLCNSEISLNVRDTEDTLDDASKSQQKVYEKMNDPIAVANKQNCWRIDYAQINALYKDFVPQKKLSAEQKYFPSSLIPSDKNSNATPSIPRDIKEMKDVFESTESELCKLEKQNDFLKDQLLEVSLKHEVELNENVSLDFTMQSLIKERDNVKLEYQKLLNSIKKTQSQTQTEMDELIAHVSKKTYAYGAIRAENQNLLFTISKLKTRLANVEKGMNAASSVRRPMNKDSHVKNSVLANSKKPAKKVAVYVRKNKQTDITSENVISNKENVIDVDVANAPKAKTLLCVSCMQNVLIPCHDNCFANYKLNVRSNVRRPLSTKSRTPKSYDTTYVVRKTRFSKESTLSKSLDTTHVVSKPKIDVGSTSKANDKVVQIVLWIVDSGCSKHMTGDRSLLKIFIEKFMGTVRFGNDNFAAITGYGDYIQGNITICHVYYVEGLGHNLFSVGQFCDGDLEVAFRSKTCYVRNLEGDDLLTGDRESNLYTISISDMAASSPVCLMSKATSTKSWLWHRRLSHLNFGTINDLTRLDLVDGLPKFKYGKDHLCERGKSKKDSHPLKLVPSDHSKLELLHMDLCGPMRVASINGKKYILVIVDDYSRYTWVYFLHSKDETPEIIKKFIAQAQLNYKAKVCKIRTDNGTEFKNATLKAHYEKLGIMQQFSTAQTPQQNGVVERRNRTLVEAARTMLIFSRLLEFLWAKVVATTCFTQNPSIIHTRHNKTPYELLRGRKPNVEYFHVFGSLCYPINDRDDFGKMKPKADIGVFIGYSETSRGFQICNRRTKKIMETINVNFDELTAMASEHDCLEPELQRFKNHNSSAEEMNTPTKEDLDNLFGPMFEEYFEKTFFDTPINSAAQPTQIHEDSPSTSSIIVDEHEAPPIVTTSDKQTSPISLTEADEFNQEDSAHSDRNS
ncbi:retrovirus-related pol polyprotein from transposon TNT 1-94 [Tanacetum coccineum]